MIYQTVQINNLTGKYIMKLSKLKHLQRYITSSEIYFRRFKRQPQSYQLSITFTPSMEVIFETLETAYDDMIPPHSIIETIVNSNFGNTFHHKNWPNQRQPTKNNSIQSYQKSNTRQQYHHKHTGQ